MQCFISIMLLTSVSLSQRTDFATRDMYERLYHLLHDSNSFFQLFSDYIPLTNPQGSRQYSLDLLPDHYTECPVLLYQSSLTSLGLCHQFEPARYLLPAASLDGCFVGLSVFLTDLLRIQCKLLSPFAIT